ncbi:MAG: TIGR00730 family Rossman fold protein [Candidatus Nanopelagicales bacterium]|nr:TIGR00730 family Rossman fold protein [Candidatus Nanopelagicales bacterium]
MAANLRVEPGRRIEGRRVCVFTASAEPIDPRYLDLAARVGSEMSRRGMDLVTGGGRVSTMGAIARAVRAGGGHTVGVIPRGLYAAELADTDADELIVTADMRQRKGLMDAKSDAFLVLPGGIGTVEELVEVWVSRALDMHRKPIVVLDPWGDLGGLRELIVDLHRRGFVRREVLDEVEWTASMNRALDAIEGAWSS